MSDQERLNEAIHYAVDCHAAQCRKGSHRPYILHPLEALTILNAMGADPNLMIAGLLHDTVEDTDATLEDIRQRFGSDVADLVGAHTEDKSKTWKERKMAAIAALRQADRRVTLLVLSDKLSNLRSMVRDYRVQGDRLWERFHAPKQQQQWYYSGILDALKPMEADSMAAPFYREMTQLFEILFCSIP